jgi:cell volume regulation protein A
MSHLDHAPRVGATLPLDEIVLVVARAIGGNRVNVVGLRLPEDEEPPAPPLTRAAAAKRKLSRIGNRLLGS